jgi:hypothetical protein
MLLKGNCAQTIELPTAADARFDLTGSHSWRKSWCKKT